jgi:hypothetical protein
MPLLHWMQFPRLTLQNVSSHYSSTFLLSAPSCRRRPSSLVQFSHVPQWLGSKPSPVCDSPPLIWVSPSSYLNLMIWMSDHFSSASNCVCVLFCPLITCEFFTLLLNLYLT